MAEFINHWYGKDRLKQVRDLIGELKSIPHLQLPYTPPVEKILEESKSIKEWIGYQLEEDRPEDQKELYKSNWLGRGLIDWWTDSARGMAQTRNYDQSHNDGKEFHSDGSAVMKITDVGRKMPQTIQSIYQICKNPYRCRIMKIKANGNLNWHSHCQFDSGRYPVVEYGIMVVHFPIYTPSGCRWGVRDFNNDKSEPLFEVYQPGSSWLFNSWHKHNVINEGNEDRLSLVLYLPITDERLESLLRQAVSNYTGPRI